MSTFDLKAVYSDVTCSSSEAIFAVLSVCCKAVLAGLYIWSLVWESCSTVTDGSTLGCFTDSLWKLFIEICHCRHSRWLLTLCRFLKRLLFFLFVTHSDRPLTWIHWKRSSWCCKVIELWLSFATVCVPGPNHGIQMYDKLKEKPTCFI